MNRVVFAETLRRHINAGVPIFFAFIAFMTAATANSDAAGAVWRPMLTLMIIIAAAQLIGPEFSSGTLQLILAKPVNRSEYVISRIAGVAVVMWVVTWALVGVEAMALLNSQQSGWSGRLVAAGLNTSAKTLLVCALLAFFGSFSRAYFNVAYYFFVQLVVTAAPPSLRALQRQPSGFLGWLGSIVRNHPGMIKAFLFADENLFPSEPQNIDRNWLLLVVSNAAIAIVVACLIFRTREVPYGSD